MGAWLRLVMYGAGQRIADQLHDLETLAECCAAAWCQTTEDMPPTSPTRIGAESQHRGNEITILAVDVGSLVPDFTRDRHINWKDCPPAAPACIKVLLHACHTPHVSAQAGVRPIPLKVSVDCGEENK